MSRIAVVGDVLLDRDLDGRAERLCPDAPAPVVEGVVARDRPGGAGLAATLLAADGHEVTLVTALAPDGPGELLRALLAVGGVAVADVGRGGTTSEKVRVRASGRVLVRVDHGGAAPAVGDLGPGTAAALGGADAVLVSDYGRGMTAAAPVRRALAATAAPVVWDPHPRGASPVPCCALLTPNAAEAAGMTGAEDPAEAAARLLRDAAAAAVAVTMGDRGALLARAGDAAVARVAAPPASGDPCGAGDRFASAAAGALAAGATPAEAVREAVGVAARFVAVGGAGAAWTLRPRIVATGGCFDLLHPGHIATLQAARALGERLVVLLNSDASVRRLKGPDRPVLDEHERAAMLRALRWVDEVVVFDEDTPERALARLAPDVWVKGADYDAEELPEAALVRRLGGEVVTVPYIAGRSTTRLIEEVSARAER